MSLNTPPDQEFCDYPRLPCKWCGKDHPASERCAVRSYQRTTTALTVIVLLGIPLVCFGGCVSLAVGFSVAMECILAGWGALLIYVIYRTIKARKMRGLQ